MNYLTIVSEVTGVSVDNIMSTSRKREISQARHLCMYFYQKEKKLSEIGRILNREHATVIHGCKVISGLLDINDKQIKYLVDQITLNDQNTSTELIQKVRQEVKREELYKNILSKNKKLKEQNKSLRKMRDELLSIINTK